MELCPPDAVIQLFSDQCNNPEFSDVTFVFEAEGKELHAHRMVLCAHSEVFKKMLTAQMTEGLTSRIVLGPKGSGKQEQAEPHEPAAAATAEDAGDEVEYTDLEDIDSALVLKVLNFLYFNPIAVEDVYECIQLMSFAHQYMLTTLFATGKEALKSMVSHDTVLDILQFARKYAVKDLEEVCWKCVDILAGDLVKTDRFLALEEDLLVDMLDRELMIEEVPLFEAVLDWGKKRVTPTATLGQILKRALPLIRFPQIERKYLITRVKLLEIVSAELYIEALEFIALGPEGLHAVTTSPAGGHSGEHSNRVAHKRFQKRFVAPAFEAEPEKTPKKPMKKPLAMYSRSR